MEAGLDSGCTRTVRPNIEIVVWLILSKDPIYDTHRVGQYSKERLQLRNCSERPRRGRFERRECASVRLREEG